MYRSVISLAAEGVIVDQQTNQVSIYNIYEGMLAVGYPLFMHKIVFFTYWEREANDPEEIEGQVTIHLNNDELLNQIVNVNFQGKLRSRNIIALDGLLISQPGQLVFKFLIEGHDTSEYAINLEALPADVAQEPQTV